MTAAIESNGLAPDIDITPWMLRDGGALDIDLCPDCWERRAHIERYELARRALSGTSVLDFGCGVGFGSRMLAARNLVSGVDSSAEALRLARERGEPNMFTERIPDVRFDACVAFEVIEHLNDPRGFIAVVPARQLIASVPVIPTVWRNPHHKHDFTVQSFRNLLETRFFIKYWWTQMQPFHNTPSIAIFHGVER